MSGSKLKKSNKITENQQFEKELEDCKNRVKELENKMVVLINGSDSDNNNNNTVSTGYVYSSSSEDNDEPYPGTPGNPYRGPNSLYGGRKKRKKSRRKKRRTKRKTKKRRKKRKTKKRKYKLK